MDIEAAVIMVGMFNMQVCVPKLWDNRLTEDFAKKTPCGTTCGWSVDMKSERVSCAQHDENVHVLLDA